jgi:hypothetical protein
MERKGLIRTNSVESDPGKKTEPKNKNGSVFFGFLKKYPVFSTILISLIVLVGVYLWLDLRSTRQSTRLIRSAEAQIAQTNRDMLMLLSRPMVWSIRAEMLRGNNEQIDLFISDMVRERNFRNILITNINGEVILSTNKMQEGQQAEQYVKAEMLSSENTLVETDDNNNLILSAPILGFDRRLGTLIIEYQPENFEPAAR